MDIQTDSYLEELTERTVEFEAETQTDFLLDRPPSPLFMPAKIGVDTETQIEEGELFDFDVECEPILEVLVGKTLEQSMLEVLEEEELESLRKHQEDFEARRNAELAVSQRMEAAEKRRSDEIARRLQQQTARREQELSVMRKVVSRSIASHHLSSIKERAFGHLFDAGLLVDSVQLAVENDFMQSLVKAVQSQIDRAHEDKNVIDDVLKSAASGSICNHDAKLQTERRRLSAIDRAERDARDEKVQQREARELEVQRIKAEQDSMVEWEQYVPPPPPVEPERHISSVNDENMAVYGEDGLVASVPEDKLQELKDMIAQAVVANEGREEGAEGDPVPDQIVIGKMVASDGGMVLESFRLGTAADLDADLPADEAADPTGDAGS